MAKLSVIVPSRNERFLLPTIEDIFRHRRGETEVIAVLDQSDWPEDWKELCAKYPDLHTVHQGQSKGMRAAINAGVGSAISRGAKYIMKTDGHCSFSEGFDEILNADCEPNWVVVPRRGRLDPESWTATDTHKPDIDYHYLSFPDDPNDFGGKGLNGKVWLQRAIDRADILIDEEMSSQGSCWFMHAKYFTELELMDEAHYGSFWNEFQEIGLKCWLSGGKVMVNKRAKYLHLHKGSKYGRGYSLDHKLLTQGATYTKNWIWNEAWDKQTLPFKSLIERFWPVPSWPDDWEKRLYQDTGRRPRVVAGEANYPVGPPDQTAELKLEQVGQALKIYKAHYGTGSLEDLNVLERLQSLVKDDSLDIIVNNSTLCPGQNPFRGQRKQLNLTYGFRDNETITVTKQEKEWLIIGTPRTGTDQFRDMFLKIAVNTDLNERERDLVTAGDRWLTRPDPMTAAQINDLLIRRFNITPYRLRAPMPIELPNFHRDDLATLFAELGFNRGAEIGVAEGKYSEVLVKANPQLELLCIDPWAAYDGNAQQKTREKHEYAYNETKRRLTGSKAQLISKTSMDAVRDVKDGSLSFVYIDANHSYQYVLADLLAWVPKVRSGGIVALDDYYYIDEKRWGAGVVEAVQSYTSAMRIVPWFICAGHRSVDAFWVKP